MNSYFFERKCHGHNFLRTIVLRLIISSYVKAQSTEAVSFFGVPESELTSSNLQDCTLPSPDGSTYEKCWFTVQDLEDSSSYGWQAEVYDDHHSKAACGVTVLYDSTDGPQAIKIKYCSFVTDHSVSSTIMANYKNYLALLDLGSSYTQSSSWGSEWTNPRLTSGTGFHNSGGDDFTSTTNFGAKYRVNSLVMKKRGDGSCRDRVFSYIKIKYYDDNQNWVDYQGGSALATGISAADSQDVSRVIVFSTPFVASQVQIIVLQAYSNDGSIHYRYDFTVQNTEGNPIASQLSYDRQCSTGYYISGWGHKYKSVSSSGNVAGVSGLAFRCTKLNDNTMHESWLLDQYSATEGTWQDFHYSNDRFMCGIKVATRTDGYSDFSGIAAMKVQFCQLCNNDLVGKTGVAQTKKSIDLTVDQTRLDSGVDYVSSLLFSELFEKKYTYQRCAITCKLVDSSGNDIVDPEITSNIAVSSNQEDIANSNVGMLVIKHNPAALYSYSFKIKCVGVAGDAISEEITVTMTCGSNIVVYDPLVYNYAQSGLTTTDRNTWNTFEFTSFRTDSTACQVQKYGIFSYKESTNTPAGMSITNDYTETRTRATANNNQFVLGLDDGEIPFTYYFVIMATAEGGNIRWIEGESLNSYCPTRVDLQTTITQPYQASYWMNTYIGATGSDSYYEFPKFTPVLPKCSYVTGYSVTQTSPVGSGSHITYPSPYCRSSPCYFVDIDVTVSQQVTFQVVAISTLPAAISTSIQDITVNVALDANTPTISPTNLQDSSQVTSTAFQINQVATFQFTPFTSSDPLVPATNYQATTSSSSVVAPAIVTSSITMDASSSKMSLSIDTAALGTFMFGIYAHLTDLPMVYAYSTFVTITIGCGSEKVSVNQTDKFQMIFDKAYQTDIIISNTEFATIFSSDTNECPLTLMTFFSDSGMTTPLVSHQYFILSNPTDPSTWELSVRRHAGFRETVYIKAETAYGYSKSLEIEVIVCGNEQISPVPLNESQLTYFLNQKNAFLLQKTDLESFFKPWYLEANSHASCSNIESLQLLSAHECLYTKNQTQDMNRFYLSSSNVFTARQNVKYEKESVCLQASTKSGNTAFQILNFWMCGLEVIDSEICDDHIFQNYRMEMEDPLLYHNGSFSLLYSFDIGIQSVKLSKYFCSATSSIPQCPVNQFRLLDSNREPIQDSQFSIEGTTYSDLTLKTDTSTPLSYTIIYLELGTEYGTYKDLKTFNVIVCGNENFYLRQESIFFKSDGKKDIGEKIKLDAFLHLDGYFWKHPQQSYDQEIMTKDNMYCLLKDTNLKLVSDLKGTPLSIEEASLVTISNENERAKDPHNFMIRAKLTDEFFKGKTKYTFYIQIEGRTGKILYMNIVVEIKDISFDIGIEGKSADMEFEQIYNIDDMKDPAFSLINCPGHPELYCQPVHEILQFTLSTLFEVVVSEKTLSQYSFVKIFHQDSGFHIGLIKSKCHLYDLYQMKSVVLIIESKYLEKEQIRYYLAKIKFVSDLDFTLLNELSLVKEIEQVSDSEIEFNFEFLCGKEVYERQIDTGLITDSTSLICNEFLREAVEIDFQNIMEIDDGATDIEKQLSNRPTLFKNKIHFKFNIDVITRLYYESTHFATISEFYDATNIADVKLEITKQGEAEENKVLFSFDQIGLMTNKTLTAMFDSKAMSSVDFSDNEPLSLIKASLDSNHLLTLKFNKNLMRIKQKYLDELIDETIVYLAAESVLDEEIVYPGKKDLDHSESLTQEDRILLPQEQAEYQRLQFGWNDLTFWNNEIRIQLNFTYGEELSLTTYGKDALIVTVFQNQYFRHYRSGKMLQDEEYTFYLNLHPLLKDENQKKVVESTKISINPIQILQSQQLVVNIIVSKSLQDLWGMLNTQQISNHIPLIGIPLPAMSNMYTKIMSEMNGKDMYPTEEIFEEYFNFTEKDALNDDYELLGYDSSNFIPLSGSLVINIVIIAITAIFMLLLDRLLMIGYRFRCFRQAAIRLGKVSILEPVSRLFTQQFMELLVCVLVTIKSNQEQDYVDNGYDIFSSGVAFATLFICFFILIAMIIQFIRIRKRLDEDEIQQTNTIILDGLKIDSTMQAAYHIIYLIRRSSLVLSCFVFDGIPLLQLFINIYVSQFYQIYLLHNQPCVSQETNRMDIVNELGIFIICMSFILMCDSKYELNSMNLISYIHVGTGTIIILINFAKLFYGLIVHQIPDGYKWCQACQNKRRLNAGRRDWIQSKKDAIKRHPGVYIFEKQRDELEQTLQMAELKKKISAKKENIQLQLEWLEKGNMDTSVLQNEQDELKSMEQEHFLHGGKFGRVYVFPEKIHVDKIIQENPNFQLTKIYHADINGPLGKLSKIEKHLEDEAYCMVKETMNIFKCIAINVYGSPKWGRRVKNRVWKFLDKSKERFQATFLNNRRPNESEKDHEMAETYKQIQKVQRALAIPIEFYAASILYKLPIVVYTAELEDNAIAFTFKVEDSTKPFIHLLRTPGGLIYLIHRHQYGFLHDCFNKDIQVLQFMHKAQKPKRKMNFLSNSQRPPKVKLETSLSQIDEGREDLHDSSEKQISISQSEVTIE